MTRTSNEGDQLLYSRLIVRMFTETMLEQELPTRSIILNNTTIILHTLKSIPHTTAGPVNRTVKPGGAEAEDMAPTHDTGVTTRVATTTRPIIIMAKAA